jgi:DNA helicase-2/ATP-dependent DNA helicase PcrA
MAAAAAIVIARYHLNAQRYLVVVTFTRSAALNIKAKIRQNLQGLGLPPTGFMVSTVHGLALQIATRQGNASGIDWENNILIDPKRSHRLVQTTIDQWMADVPEQVQELLQGQKFDGEETERLRRQSVLRTEVLPELLQTIVHEAKSSGLTPQDLYHFAATYPVPEDPYGILTIAAGLYDRYQQNLRAGGYIDYDDMIVGALQALQNPTYRHFWQQQVFAVFEDEAQDSSPLQFKLLEILAESPQTADAVPSRNLIRVGDPNQAINSTFTPADPLFFRQFCQRCQSQGRLVQMDQAGRSAPPIIDAANTLVAWVNQQFQGPLKNSGQAGEANLPFRAQIIHPVPPQDPQRNPNPEGNGVEIICPPTLEASLEALSQRVRQIFQQDRDFQGAILVRENRQGQFLADRLQPLADELGLRIYEVGEQTRNSQVPQEMITLLQFLQRPHSPDYLKAALQVLSDRQLIPSQDFNRLATYPEIFLYPTALDPSPADPVRQAQRLCTQLLRARQELPPSDLIAFLGLSLRYDQRELATADKLADHCRQRISGDLSLPGLLVALQDLYNTEKFDGVDPQALESVYTAPRQLTIITMHKAKGLDWNYVFLPFLHAKSIPGNSWVPAQAEFLGQYTLAAITRSLLRHWLHQTLSPEPVNVSPLNPTQAWQEADYLKRSEEYRLFYVAMTRAKRLLWMAAEQEAPFSWHNPDQRQSLEPTPVIPVLQNRFAAMP